MESSTLNGRTRSQFYRLLKDLPTDGVVSSVHYAGRLLERRHDLKDVRHGFIVPGIASEPTESEQKVALMLIAHMEQAEGQPVRLFTDQQAAKYVNRLGSVVTRRTRQQYGYDPERGKRLLAELRSHQH